MPSNTFLNLNKEKRDKIIEVSLKEFSSSPYPEVSINKIIMNAGIPRGSFYMYFESKEDLFEYLMEEHYNRFIINMNACFDNNDGDLRNTFISMYEKSINYIKRCKVDGFFKNVFMYMNMNKAKFREPEIGLYDEFKDKIDSKNIKYNDLELVFYMLLQTLFTSVALSTKEDCKFKKDDYLKRLNIICYGIYKEDYNDKDI